MGNHLFEHLPLYLFILEKKMFYIPWPSSWRNVYFRMLALPHLEWSEVRITPGDQSW